jgi:uncharacterized protein involved in exopolysaccharide biosynthesis
MTDDKNPNVEEIKIRLGDEIEGEIPVDEDTSGDPQTFKAEVEETDITAELRGLGRKFAETIQTAWNSEERQKVEADVRQGMKSFADEIDKVIKEAKESPTTAKAKEGATEFKTRVETAEIGQKARSGFVQSLRWLSEELGKLANQFTPTEKNPEDVAGESEESE